LSTLELIAHRHSIDVQSGYKVMSLQINVRPSEIKTIEEKDLPKNWKSIVSYPLLQEIGSNWYHSKKELILKVPSAIIPKEHNYLLNTHHPDFDKKISIETVEDFYWDKRLL
jgi:RES domain-containing protein